MVADRGFPPLTEVESETSDPEGRVDSVVDALQHDLEDCTPSPIVDLSSSIRLMSAIKLFMNSRLVPLFQLPF